MEYEIGYDFDVNSQVGFFWQNQGACNDTRKAPQLAVLKSSISSQAVQFPTPFMKVKDDGFQHDENHATCRSKGTISLWTIGAFHYEVFGGLHLA